MYVRLYRTNIHSPSILLGTPVHAVIQSADQVAVAQGIKL